MAFDLISEVNKELKRTDIDPSAGMPDIPQAIRLFLGQLSLLQGVPLYYLLPDERYLPKTVVTKSVNGANEEIEMGSLKLFRLDKEWIECLLDGATSIGQDEDRQLLLAKAMAGNYAAEVFYTDTKEKIKKQLYGLYSPEDHVKELNKRLAAKNISFLDSGQGQIDGRLADNGQPKPTAAQSNWCYSGFFMRSTIIASWIGVEVVAEGKDPNVAGADPDKVRPLQVVRFERLAEDTIFCICEGMISQVVITQPQETVHFGVSETNGAFDINNTKVLMRNERAVLNITDLAGKLNVNDGANFANVMLSKPLKLTIDINWKMETPTA